MVVSLPAEMKDMRGSACFENCETEFRCSKCIRQGEREGEERGSRVVRTVAKYMLWKAEEIWKIKGWDLPSDENMTTSTSAEV